MDTALIVVGLLLLGILGMWAYSSLSDPKDIDEAEEEQVRQESPAERERESFGEAVKAAESNAEDIAFYSPGESNEEHSE